MRLDKVTICGQCGRVRGKYAQPWRVCACGKVLCLICVPRFRDAQCHKCWEKEWSEECKRLKRIPVECVCCHQKKLPRAMKYPYDVMHNYSNLSDSLRICRACDKCQRRKEEAAKKREAVPGLVKVVYGEHPAPTEDGGNGYSYYFDQPLRLGNIVEVPQTWLGKIRQQNGPNLATVVSTYSDYTGVPSSILRIVREKCNEQASDS